MTGELLNLFESVLFEVFQAIAMSCKMTLLLSEALTVLEAQGGSLNWLVVDAVYLAAQWICQLQMPTQLLHVA